MTINTKSFISNQEHDTSRAGPATCKNENSNNILIAGHPKIDKLKYSTIFSLLALLCTLLSTELSAQNKTDTFAVKRRLYSQLVKEGVSKSDYKNDTAKKFFDYNWNSVEKQNAEFLTISYPVNGSWMCEDYNVYDGKLLQYASYANCNLTVLEKEAIRVIEAMPICIPGTDHGMPIDVLYLLPLTFSQR